MSISNEQKNKNILSRFDTEKTGTKIKKYTFELDGKNVQMINMQGADISQIIESLNSRWGNRVQNVRQS